MNPYHEFKAMALDQVLSFLFKLNSSSKQFSNEVTALLSRVLALLLTVLTILIRKKTGTKEHFLWTKFSVSPICLKNNAAKCSKKFWAKKFELKNLTEKKFGAKKIWTKKLFWDLENFVARQKNGEKNWRELVDKFEKMAPDLYRQCSTAWAKKRVHCVDTIPTRLMSTKPLVNVVIPLTMFFSLSNAGKLLLGHLLCNFWSFDLTLVSFSLENFLFKLLNIFLSYCEDITVMLQVA